MLRLDKNRVYRAPNLDNLDWITHGFGTRLSAGWPPEPRVTLKQMHSSTVLVPTVSSGCVGEGDALVTNCPGVVLSVRTADCLPILLADPVRRAVAAVHAGWRGTASEVVPQCLARMGSEFGTRPEDVLAAIGPGIGKCCYEVDLDVAQAFTRWLPELPVSNGKAMLDLPEVNRRQLIAAGVLDQRIVCAAPCTFCTPGEFHSYRRERNRERMVSTIAIL